MVNTPYFWTDNFLDHCLMNSYLETLMSSTHQLGFVLRPLHEEKLVYGKPFPPFGYTSLPFPERNKYHQFLVFPVILSRDYLLQAYF